MEKEKEGDSKIDEWGTKNMKKKDKEKDHFDHNIFRGQ